MNVIDDNASIASSNESVDELVAEKGEIASWVVYPILATPDDLTAEALKDFNDISYRNYIPLEPNGGAIEYQSKIPELMNACIDTLARSTGGRFFVIGCWDGPNGETMCSTHATSAVRAYVATPAGQAARDSFIRYAEDELGETPSSFVVQHSDYFEGPLFNTKVNLAHPVVYGAPEDTFRPRMPPEHVEHMDERENTVQWMDHLAEWQGNDGPPDWAAIERDLSTGGRRFIDPKRLPVNRPSFSNPLEWTEQETRIMSGHIRSHQMRILAGDDTQKETAFQFRTVFKENGDIRSRHDRYRERVHPLSRLLYPASAALYFARTLSLQERFQPAFSVVVKSYILAVPEYGPSLERLIDVTERLAADTPVQLDITLVPGAPPILKWLKNNDRSLEEILRSYELPLPFYNISSQSFDQWSIFTFGTFIRQRTYQVRHSESIPSGREGIALLIVALAIIAKNVVEPIEPHLLEGQQLYVHGSPNDKNYLRVTTAIFLQDLTILLQHQTASRPQEKTVSSRFISWSPTSRLLAYPQGETHQLELAKVTQQSERGDKTERRAAGPTPAQSRIDIASKLIQAASRPARLATTLLRSPAPKEAMQNVIPASSSEDIRKMVDSTADTLLGPSVEGVSAWTRPSNSQQGPHKELPARNMSGTAVSGMERILEGPTHPTTARHPEDHRQVNSDRPGFLPLPPHVTTTAYRSASMGRAERVGPSGFRRSPFLSAPSLPPSSALGLTDLVTVPVTVELLPQQHSTPAERGRPVGRELDATTSKDAARSTAGEAITPGIELGYAKSGPSRVPASPSVSIFGIPSASGATSRTSPARRTPTLLQQLNADARPDSPNIAGSSGGSLEVSETPAVANFMKSSTCRKNLCLRISHAGATSSPFSVGSRYKRASYIIKTGLAIHWGIESFGRASMPPSIFNAAEKAFLSSYIPDWSLQRKQPNTAADVHPRTKLERQIIVDFFERFPDRDEHGERAFPEDTRAGFEKTLNQWYINKTRGHNIPSALVVDKSARRTTARTLIAQQNRDTINARSQELRAARSDLNHMQAWNMATSEAVETMRTENPEELAWLHAAAAQQRASKTLDFTEQTEEDLDKLLRRMPKELIQQIKEWTRTTGAVFYTIALFELPKRPGLQTVEALSTSISGFTQSSNGDKARELLIDWVVDELGASLSRSPDAAQPTVFPDKYNDSRPVMPEVVNVLKITKGVLTTWIRDFLNSLWPVETMRTENPEELARLHAVAAQQRASKSLDFTERTEEDLDKLLRRMPKELIQQIKEWTRTTGAVFYTIALFELPKRPGLQTVEALSTSISGFTQSSNGDKARELLIDWVVDELGASLSRSPDAAQPTVFPDKYNDSRPVMPEVVNILKITKGVLTTWIRDFLNSLWQWQGAPNGVPWKRICADTGYTFAEAHRLPVDLAAIPNHSSMDIDACRVWYNHLRLSGPQRFQFRRVETDSGGLVASYDSLCLERHPRSPLEWEAGAKVYARHVDRQRNPATNARAWKGLPTARFEGLYIAIDETNMGHLLSLDKPNISLSNLGVQINKYEQHGPAHMEDTALPVDTINAHFPANFSDTVFENTVANRWAHAAFFDEDHEEHDAYALATLTHWIKHSTKFRHIPSGTWLGGPDGLRWVLAVLACLVTSLSCVDRRIQVPVDIQAVHSESFQTRAWNQITALTNWLDRSIQNSVDTLTQTLPQRQDAWKEAVLSEYQHRSNNPHYSGSGHSNPKGRSTNGVPSSFDELHAYAQMLMQIDNTLSDVPSSYSAPLATISAAGGEALHRAESLGRLRPRASQVSRDEPAESFDLDGVRGSSEDEGSEHESWSPAPNESSSGKLPAFRVCDRSIAYIRPTDESGIALKGTQISEVFTTSRRRSVPGLQGRRTTGGKDAEISTLDQLRQFDAESDIGEPKRVTLVGSHSPTDTAGLGTRNQGGPAGAESSTGAPIPAPPKKKGKGKQQKPASPAADSVDEEPVSTSRPRRNATRTKAAQEAIRAAPKGRYQR
ncbi:hypothetical protein BDV93DRAFT_515073 [Ceratobasidium sp. AG-I]|nr:hypothetical protein BDV93DRAFT_515073 [Ceratobasidium sp. AG-I]